MYPTPAGWEVVRDNGTFSLEQLRENLMSAERPSFCGYDVLPFEVAAINNLLGFIDYHGRSSSFWQQRLLNYRR